MFRYKIVYVFYVYLKVCCVFCIYCGQPKRQQRKNLEVLTTVRLELASRENPAFDLSDELSPPARPVTWTDPFRRRSTVANPRLRDLRPNHATRSSNDSLNARPRHRVRFGNVTGVEDARNERCSSPPRRQREFIRGSVGYRTMHLVQQEETREEVKDPRRRFLCEACGNASLSCRGEVFTKNSKPRRRFSLESGLCQFGKSSARPYKELTKENLQRWKALQRLTQTRTSVCWFGSFQLYVG